jgi:hypothetical protein
LSWAHRPPTALSAALEQCGGAERFLQAAFDVVHRHSNFFCNPSAVSSVTAMASAVRAQVVAKEGEAALEVKNKAAVAEVAKVASAMAQIGMSPSLSHQNGRIEGCNPLLTVAEIPLPP